MLRFGRHNRNRQVPRLEPRIAGITILMTVALGLVAVRLYYLQIIRHKPLAEMADRNRIRIRRLPALRGLVYDSEHRPLVDTRPGFDAVLVPEDTRNLSQTIERLEQYLGGQDQVAAKVVAAEKAGRPEYQPIIVQEHLTWPQVVALETHQLQLPGVSLQVSPARHYIYGTLAAHLLGYVGEVTQRDLTRDVGYHMGDDIGKFGLEEGWEPYLRGDAGGEEMEVDAVGRPLRVLREIPEKPGDSVIMTLNLDLQQVAEQALGDQTGAVVVLDPNTGYILAFASHPAFDPDLFASGITPAKWHQLARDPEHPLEDRVIQGIYPPGSTFKIVDTIAGLMEGTLHADTHYDCPGGLWYGGREYHCWRKQGHGYIALHRAIVSSCDVYFYHVGIALGVDRIAKWAHLLGLGKKTGIDLANENPGIIPSTAWKWRRYHQRWYPAETLSVAIGQGYVAVTPMQMAQVAEQVANGGTRYQPQFVREVLSLDGRVVKYYPPVIESKLNIPTAYIQFLHDAMADVVTSPWGTAHRVHIPGVVVCAKTGTAQLVGLNKAWTRGKNGKELEKYKDDGWLIAYAPENHPRIAAACVIEHGGHGGVTAAPVIRAIFQKYFEMHPPPPPPPPTPDITKFLKLKPEGAVARSN